MFVSILVLLDQGNPLRTDWIYMRPLETYFNPSCFNPS